MELPCCESAQNLEPGGSEMAVKRESLLDVQAAHDGETGTVDRFAAGAAPSVEEVPGSVWSAAST